MYNHLRQGGKRAAWISASPDLLIDAQRDLNELDLEPELTIATMPPGARNVKKMEKQASDGIVYGTYATLARSFNGTGVGPNGVECLPEGSRLKQLVDFLAKDENGPLIVLDECHRAKNAYEKTNEDTVCTPLWRLNWPRSAVMKSMIIAMIIACREKMLA